MYIVATFEHSLDLELVLSELEIIGISSKSILALPLKKRNHARKLFDSIHHSDGISLFDGLFAVGSAFMVLGVIYGFVWEWGPIICGLLGLVIGGIIGFTIDYFINRLRTNQNRIIKQKSIPTEVVLLINASDEKTDILEQTLWEHSALGVAKLDMKQ